ncbi:uncharacterized protein LOC121800822 [Salvia splendens]|uniref:uncharacterized protein LOC121800822 n=1 Tax=Salvia splendens TaxID=180675 RepID=UPI001C27EA7C|nr:uncharacterized protein LOC121800822 [Salvia splendens]
MYWAEFKKSTNCEAYDQDECKKAFISKCKLRYEDFISYYKKKTKKPSFYTDAQWANYQKGWNLPESIEASERCSENRKQGLETVPGTHSNGRKSFAETTEMAKENNGKLPQFMEFFLKTHKLRNGGDSQGHLCSQRAQQIVDDVMARAEELQAEGIKNSDYEAIFLELFGKVKKRKQISSSGQATSISFPLATYSSVGLPPSMLAGSMK